MKQQNSDKHQTLIIEKRIKEINLNMQNAEKALKQNLY